MKKSLLFILIHVCFGFGLRAQVLTFHNARLIPLKLVGLSRSLRDVPEKTLTEKERNAPRKEHGNESLERSIPYTNPHPLPAGEDPARQMEKADPARMAANVNILSNWAGLTANTDPSDNTIAVGPNHVMQMTNTATSSLIKIWDKSGTVLVNNKTTLSITGITDYGDPDVLYDWQADRFVFNLLYSGNDNELVVCVSQTSDPTGAYYVYTFNTTNGYPDYPKIAVWGDSYIITTNSDSPEIFALNRTAMLSGGQIGNVQAFSLSAFPTIGFQSASPVTQTGWMPPDTGTPCPVLRTADDAWNTSVGPDHLEIFQVAVDWSTPSNSSVTGPINLNTLPYDSRLCSFTSASCVPMMGTNRKLDPLSNILMDKVQYRNFGNYQSIVCSNVCNADGAGTAGVRWYELRNSGNGWSIYQQSTYSPNTTGRFMSSITMNGEGTIALGYNVSSSSMYPGIRITGRDSCEALNTMTLPETVVQNGSSANSTSRYGDYNGMVTDPVDGTFWFTANYNPTSSWATNVVHFTFDNCAILSGVDPIAAVSSSWISNLSIVPNPANDQIRINFTGLLHEPGLLEIVDISGKLLLRQSLQVTAGENSVLYDAASLAGGCYFVRLLSSQGSATQKLLLTR